MSNVCSKQHIRFASAIAEFTVERTAIGIPDARISASRNYGYEEPKCSSWRLTAGSEAELIAALRIEDIRHEELNGSKQSPRYNFIKLLQRVSENIFS